MMVIF